MRLHFAVAIASVAALTACSQSAQNTTPKTDEEKQLYTLGVLVSRNIQSFEFTDKEMEMVKAGVDDGARDKAKLKQQEMEALVPKLQEMQTKRVEASAEKQKSDGTAYQTKAAAEKGATKLPSGLIYRSTQEGTGETPKDSDTVKVKYVGKLVSGKVFDDSAEHEDGPTATFPLNGVIPCWTEGLQQMKVGGKAVLVCPPEIAYGAEGRPPQMPGNATLTFDVELVEIMKDEPAAAGAAPADAHPAH